MLGLNKGSADHDVCLAWAIIVSDGYRTNTHICILPNWLNR
jgi:hypothetical protein